jgi:nitroimidazol reductase NimA-like FMN-containing flavoprotein (pyridoxamine 5'-phosphate oxidase superfamily)
MTSQPDFHTLDRAECEALLSTQQVGRLAFTFRDRVDIEPMHDVYRDGCVYGRTQYGTKVDVLAHHPWVAFEVDAIAAFRTLVPGAFSDDDPTPARGLAFVIPVQEMTGRAATVGGTG